MAAADDGAITDTVVVVSGALIIIAVIAVILMSLAPVTDALIGGSHTWNPTTGTSETLTDANERPQALSVYATTEQQLQLHTHHAHIQTPAGLPNGTWTVCVTAALSSDANQQASIDIVGIENETLTTRFVNGSWQSHYQPANVTANVTAPTPTQRTPICTRWNGTHLTIDTPTASDTSPQGSMQPRHVSVGLTGTLDEYRVINDSVSDADVQRYLADPIDPLDGTDHTARTMLDETSGGTAPLYYHSGAVTVVGESAWVDGVPDPGLTEDTDYRVDTAPLRVTPLQGGYLAGAPVVYAEWGGTAFGGILPTLFGLGATALALLVLATLVIAAGAVWQEFTW